MGKETYVRRGRRSPLTSSTDQITLLSDPTRVNCEWDPRQEGASPLSVTLVVHTPDPPQ